MPTLSLPSISRGVSVTSYVTHQLALPGGELRLLQPSEAAELPDDGAIEWAPLVPYWSVLWRSGVALARELAEAELAGRHVVELGCGLGAPSVVPDGAFLGQRVRSRGRQRRQVWPRQGRRARNVRRPEGKQQPSRVLLEIEVPPEVAQPPRPFAHAGARVRSPVSTRVEALAAKEIVLDELQVGVEAQRLVVDVAPPRVRADHQPGNPDPVLLPADARRRHVVVEAAPVVPREKDRGALPVGPLHDRVDHACDVVLAGADRAERMLAVVAARDNPRDCREPTGASIVE